jgi:hypothetical protein
MWILLLVLFAIVILAAREAFLFYIWLEELQRARQRFHADLHRSTNADSDVRGQA